MKTTVAWIVAPCYRVLAKTSEQAAAAICGTNFPIQDGGST